MATRPVARRRLAWIIGIGLVVLHVAVGLVMAIDRRPVAFLYSVWFLFGGMVLGLRSETALFLGGPVLSVALGALVIRGGWFALPYALFAACSLAWLGTGGVLGVIMTRAAPGDSRLVTAWLVAVVVHLLGVALAGTVVLHDRGGFRTRTPTSSLSRTASIILLIIHGIVGGVLVAPRLPDSAGALGLWAVVLAVSALVARGGWFALPYVFVGLIVLFALGVVGFLGPGTFISSFEVGPNRADQLAKLFWMKWTAAIVTQLGGLALAAVVIARRTNDRPPRADRPEAAPPQLTSL